MFSAHLYMMWRLQTYTPTVCTSRGPSSPVSHDNLPAAECHCAVIVHSPPARILATAFVTWRMTDWKLEQLQEEMTLDKYSTEIVKSVQKLFFHHRCQVF